MVKQTVLVTGASGNLGKAVAEAFARHSYSVYGFVHNKQANNSLPANKVIPVELDLLDETACITWVQHIANNNGSIDVAVLTAGGFAMGYIADTNSKAIQQQIQLNFETAYHMARPIFLQMLQQKKGYLFFIGSKAGLDTRHALGVTAYGLSKSLLFRLAEIMRAEAKGTQLVVKVIVPSIIDTPQNRAAMPQADFAAWTTPEAIARVIFEQTMPNAKPEEWVVMV
jgi:NAD(P)-dependent dehydrogenase (short-subunit alcohol dehydrogenase family)